MFFERSTALLDGRATYYPGQRFLDRLSWKPLAEIRRELPQSVMIRDAVGLDDGMYWFVPDDV